MQPRRVQRGKKLRHSLVGHILRPAAAGEVIAKFADRPLRLRLKSFLTVTPGVRFADGDAGDQKRVTTPAKAKELGSDYIVVGRPITQAEDPVAAYRRCREEFVG